MVKGEKIFIERLFPNVNELNINHKLKINHESIAYITTPNDANKMTLFIAKHLIDFQINPKDATLIDATAGVGGNTISFSREFKLVHAIEIDPIKYNFLNNNLQVYKCSNVFNYLNNCLNVIPMIDHADVIFFDPPWGGKDYKMKDKIKIYISDIEIVDIILMFSDQKNIKSIPKLFAIKIPKNYDLDYLKSKLKNYSIHLYQLNKINMVVIYFNL